MKASSARTIAPIKRKNGYALLFLAVITVVLGIIGVSFNRQASDSRFVTRRQAHSMFLRSFAQAVAHFTMVKLQHEVSTNPDYWLRATFLEKHLSALVDTTNSIDLSEYESILAPMVEALENEGSFAYEIRVFALKNDFGPTYYSDYFPAEKNGFIRIKVKTWLRKIEEEFFFNAPIKVTSPIIPALSKFNFFLQNAAPVNDDLYFNKTKNDFRGSIIGGARPLVFNNGDALPRDITWESLFATRVGFIFLGGGDVRLNISSSTGSDVSDYGESFHFYKRSKPIPDSPFYLWDEKRNPPLNDPALGPQPTLFLRYDLGVSEPGPSDPLRDINKKVFGNAQNQYSAGPEEYINSSVLRLYGTDRKVSPTLVLGKVHRGFLSVSAAKVVPPGYPRNEMFLYPKTLSEFDSMLSAHGQGQVARLLFPAPRTDKQLEEFRTNFASGIAYQPYNLSMAFIATRNEHAGPLNEVERLSPKLSRSMSHDPDGDIVNQEALELPEQMSGMAEGKKLEDLTKMFDDPGMRFESSQKNRFAWVIDMQGTNGSASLGEHLKRGGHLVDGQLNLPGWLFVKNPPAELLIDQPIKVNGNGGIVVDKGCSLRIKSNIDSAKEDGSRFILQLVVLEGDIILDTPSIDAILLVPKGKITFQRSVEINGAMLMQNFDVTSSFPGGQINYNPALALLPGDEKFSDLLSFSFQTIPFVGN